MVGLNNLRHPDEWLLFDDSAAIARRVADDVQSIISKAIEERSSAVIAVPGGATPVPIFAELAVRDLDGPRMTLLPTDDRRGRIVNPLSNAGLIQAHFGPTAARLLTLFNGRSRVETAGRTADRKSPELR